MSGGCGAGVATLVPGCAVLSWTVGLSAVRVLCCELVTSAEDVALQKSAEQLEIRMEMDQCRLDKVLIDWQQMLQANVANRRSEGAGAL